MKKFLVSILLVFSLVALAAPAMAGSTRLKGDAGFGAETGMVETQYAFNCEKCNYTVTVTGRGRTFSEADDEAYRMIKEAIAKHMATVHNDARFK